MKNLFKNEKGLSLVEVVASIVILTLLITSFLGLILSAAKSAEHAREVIDFTFIAQRNMEMIFEKSNNHRLTELDSVMINGLAYQLNSSSSSSTTYSKNEIDSNNEAYEIKVTFTDYEGSGQFSNLAASLNRVRVEVFPNRPSQPYAIVESLLEWRGPDSE